MLEPSKETMKESLYNYKTRCNNVLLVVQYFLELGVPESEILKGIEAGKAFLSNSNNWLSIPDWYKILSNCQKFAPRLNLHDWEAIALSIKDSEASILFKTLTNFIGVSPMFSLTPRYNRRFNNYSDLEIVDWKKGYCDFLVRVNPLVNAAGMGLLVHYTAGVLSSVPAVQNLEPGQTTVIYDQALLKNIIEKMFGSFGLRYEEDGEDVFANGMKIGRKIQLKKEVCKSKSIYSRQYGFHEPYNAILIVNDLTIDTKTLLKKGEIFNAPYGRVLVQWAERKSLARLWKVLLGRKELRKRLISQFDRQLDFSKNGLMSQKG